MQITLRLDSRRFRKLEEMASATNLSRIEVLKRAIDSYYEQLSIRRPAVRLRQAGLVGCGETDPDSSHSVKAKLLMLLDAKHGPLSDR